MHGGEKESESGASGLMADREYTTLRESKKKYCLYPALYAPRTQCTIGRLCGTQRIGSWLVELQDGETKFSLLLLLPRNVSSSCPLPNTISCDMASGFVGIPHYNKPQFGIGIASIRSLISHTQYRTLVQSLPELLSFSQGRNGLHGSLSCVHAECGRIDVVTTVACLWATTMPRRESAGARARARGTRSRT